MKFHTTSCSTDQTALKCGFNKLIELAKNQINDVAYVALYNKENATAALSGILNVTLLLKQGYIIQNNITVNLLTEKTISNKQQLGPTLAVNVSLKFLKVLLNGNNTAVIYLPWMLEELTDYLSNNPDSVELMISNVK
jgi:hypothetical protein